MRPILAVVLLVAATLSAAPKVPEGVEVVRDLEYLSLIHI
jgi:hypothetical protein